MSGESDAGPADWRNRSPLSGTDLVDFLVLGRVCGNSGSGVAQVGEHFMESRRPLLPFLADGLTALIEVGHVTLGDSGPDGTRPVLATASGRARYEDLCDRYGTPAYPPVVAEETPRP